MNRPTTHAEIRNNAEMIRLFPNIDEIGDSDIVTYYITNVTFNPIDVAHLQADIEMVKSLVTFPYSFEGYVEVNCDTPTELLYECYCHFLGEGADEAECAKEIARVRALFAEAGIELPIDED